MRVFESRVMILTVICWLIHVESTIGLNVGNFVVNSWEQLPRPSTPLPEARAYHSAISTVSESGDYSMLVWGGHNGSVIVGDLSEEPQIVWGFNTSTVEWTEYQPQGTNPYGRFAHTATKVLAPDGEEYMVVFGGAQADKYGTVAPTAQTYLFGPLSFLYTARWFFPAGLNNASLPMPPARIGHVAVGAPACGAGNILLVACGLTFDPIKVNSSERNVLTPLPTDEVWVISAPSGDMDTWSWEKRVPTSVDGVSAPMLPAPRGFAPFAEVQGFVTMLGGWNGTDVSSMSEGFVWVLAVDIGPNRTVQWRSVNLTGAALPPVSLTAASYDNITGALFYWGGTAYPRAEMIITRQLLARLDGNYSDDFSDSYQSQLLFGQAAGNGGAYSVTFPAGFAEALATIQDAAALPLPVAAVLESEENGAKYANEELAPFPRVGHTFLAVGVQSIIFGGVTPFMSQYFNSTWAGGIDVETCPRATSSTSGSVKQQQQRSTARLDVEVGASKRLWWQLYFPEVNDVPPLVHSGAAVSTQFTQVDHSINPNVSFINIVPGALFHIGGVTITYTPFITLWMYVFDYGSFEDQRVSRWTQLDFHPRTLEPRAFHSAVLLYESRMVVFGGRKLDQSGASTLVRDHTFISFELSHPAQEWILTNPIPWYDVELNATAQPPESPEARFGHGAVALSRSSFAIMGGATIECTALCNCSGSILQDTWIWEGDTSSWMQGPMLPIPLFGLTVGVLDHGDHQILIVYGGAQSTDVRGPEASGGSCTVGPSHASRIMYKWVISANSDTAGTTLWETVPVLSAKPSPRFFSTAVSLGSTIIMYGGLSPKPRSILNSVLNDTWVVQLTPNGEPTWYSVNVSVGAPKIIGASAVVNSMAFEYENRSVLTLTGGLNNLYSAQAYTADQVPIMVLDVGCNAGDFSPDISAAACSACPLGTYANGSGFKECTPCGAGTTTLSMASQSIDDCNVCLPDSCHYHGDCVATAGSVMCTCQLLWEDEKTCAKLRLDLVIGSAVLLFFLFGMTFVCAMRMRRRIFKYRVANTKYEELIERRDQELDQMQRAWEIQPSSIALGEAIAEGSYGEVSRGVYHTYDVAVKMIRKENREWDLTVQTEDFKREIGLLRDLRHTNIVFFFGAGTWHDGLPFFVTEYCSRGSLRGILDTPNLPIPTSRSVRFALDAAKGMQFLHTRSPPRMHRDLKAANLLVSEDWTVKLADFGSARLLRNEHHDDEWVLLEHGSVFMDAGGADPIAHFRVPCDSSALNVMSAEVGTALYDILPFRAPVDSALSEEYSFRARSCRWLAPEIMELWARGEHSCQYSLSADVYSFGITLFEIMTRKIPYQTAAEVANCSIFALRRRICDGSRPQVPPDIVNFPRAFMALMAQCWDAQPDQRPFFTEICDRLQQLLAEFSSPNGPGISAEVAPKVFSLPGSDRHLSINSSSHAVYE